MDLFDLPLSTQVNKVIPKETFANFTSAKQKKMYSDLVSEIILTYRLTTETLKHEAKDITELQVFSIKLKAMQVIKPVLDLIDKAIPHHIIFVVQHENMFYLSTSVKHVDRKNPDRMAIEITFASEWLKPGKKKYPLDLSKSMDDMYFNFCYRVSKYPPNRFSNLSELIEMEKIKRSLENQIRSSGKSLLRLSKEKNNEEQRIVAESLLKDVPIKNDSFWE